MKLKVSVLFLILAAALTYVLLNDSYFSSSSEKIGVGQETLSKQAIYEKLYAADLKDYKGSKITIAKGLLIDEQAVIIHLWASWCGPCVGEVPELIEFSNKNPKIKFIIISLDETQEGISKFLISFPHFDSEKYIKIWDDTKSLSKFFNVDRLPMSVVIRPNKLEPQFIRAPVAWNTFTF
ncbi:MAG: TlpA disulfide reductase family protein [Bdellovibrionota bacterium]